MTPPQGLAGALADKSGLQPYGDRDVLTTSIAIRNAGDGLSAAMEIEPVTLPIGSTVFVVLECEVGGHDYLPIKNTPALELKQILRAGTATMVDGTLVRDVLDAQAEKIEQARAAARRDSGTYTLDESEMEQAHENGEHAGGLVPGCPECDREVDARAAEAGDEHLGSVSDLRDRLAGGSTDEPADNAGDE